MIGNPIISKELITILRSRTAAALTVCFVVALSLLAFSMWPESGINPAGALYSRLFFAVLLVGQLVMLALFSAPLAATSITIEREENTWEALYYSMLRADQILVGKLAGALAFLLSLVLLSLPVAASCFLLGGVSAREMLMAYLVLAVAGVSFGLIGLACSSFFRTSFSALIGTYAGLMLLCGATQVPMLLLPEWQGGQAAMHSIRCFSPFTALLAITQNACRTMGPNGSEAAVVRYFVGSAALCGVLAVVLLLRMSMRPSSRPKKRVRAVDKTTPLMVRAARRIFFIIDPRRRHRSIGSWVNPVLILDLRTRTAGIGNLLRAGFACLIFSIGLVIMVSGTWGATSPDTIRMIALSFQMGLIALIGPTLTIGAVASEIEGHTFDMLRMTPMRPWTIFWGKFMAAGILSITLLIASVPVFMAVRYIEQVNENDLLRALFAQPESLMAMFAVTCVSIIFALSAGLFFSSVCRTTARAGAWTYGLMALVNIGTLLGLILRDRLGEGLAGFILAFNPTVTVIGAVSERRFAEFGRWQNNALALGILSALLIAGCVIQLRRSIEPEN